ncbi:MAG: hypothetical protein ACHQ15_07925 [Candidatus Limnocylindrales bacterium]
MRGRAPIAVLLVLALGAACSHAGGSAGATPTPTGLAAGTYTSQAFQPSLTFTVPAGWELAADEPDYLEIRPLGSEVTGIHLFRDPAAASQDASCPESPEPAVGGTSSELSAWIRGRPGFVAGTPLMASVGRLLGVQFDLGIATGWTPSCPFANGSPTVPLFVGAQGGYRWVVAGNERLRLYLLDVPGGGTVVVDIDAFDGTLIDGLLSAATPIVESFVFATS